MSSPIDKLDSTYVVTISFYNEERKVETSVWAYHNKADADTRFKYFMDMHEAQGEKSPILHIQCVMVAIYSDYQQSEFAQLGNVKDKVN